MPKNKKMNPIPKNIITHLHKGIAISLCIGHSFLITSNPETICSFSNEVNNALRKSSLKI